MQRLDLDFAPVASDSCERAEPDTLRESGRPPGLTSDLTKASDVKTPRIVQETC